MKLESRWRRCRSLLAVSLFAGCAAWMVREPPELAGWRAQASELRGLPFRQRIPLHWITRQDLPELVRIELEEALAAGYATAYRDAIAAFGLIPPDLDLVELQLVLNQDQIAGLYSVKRRAMYVVRGGLQPDVPIVIHELVHGLQHQHFPRTLELMQGLRRNDDVVLGLGAAAEGDAMLVMLLFSQGAAELPPESAALFRAGLRSDLETPVGLLAEIPRIVRMSLLFPYSAGFDLAERSYRAAGRAGLDRMLGDAPLSSLRVRRSDAAHDVEFVRIPAAKAAELAGAGCLAGHDNVAGVLGIEALFADHGAPDASAALEPAWSGDRFLHVACPAGPELLWITRWTSPEAAAGFAAAYARIAPSVARVAPLAGQPRVETRGHTAVVATPGLLGAVDELLAAAEVRGYPDLAAWVDDGCFPESPCPLRPASDPAGAAR